MKIQTPAILILSILFILSFSSCNKKISEDPKPAITMDDLKVPDGFNWQTTKEVSLNVTMPSTIDYTNYRSSIKIMTAPETDGGVILYTGAADPLGKYLATFRIPADLENLYISSDVGGISYRIGQPKSSSAILDGIVNLGEGFDTLPPPVATGAKMNTQTRKGGISEGLPLTDMMFNSNLVQNGTFDINSFGSIPSWSSPMNADGKWYYTGELSGVVSQYNDNGNKVLRISTPTSSSYRSGGVAQLIAANPGDLITFSADMKTQGANVSNNAWLYLIPRSSSGTSLNYYSYNITPVTSLTNWARYTVAATMPAGTAYVQVLFWHWIFGGYFYWDNVVVTGPNPDSDGDGVVDLSDEYPNDPARAFNIYYPSQNGFSSLAFEDNWPGKGDYDCNDLVVDYRYQQVTNASNALVELFGKYIFRAAGASFTNAFGFQMEIDPFKINNVTGISKTENYITLSGNNTEAGQTKGTIILTDNVFTQLPFPGGGTGVNTTPGQPYVNPDTMDIHVTLTQAIPIAQAGTPPYNPFLIVNKIRGREIHLPNYLPTSLADPTYFGKENDNSEPENNRYYKTSNNLPWALDISGKFDYPIERVPIIEAYLHFASWAESSGSLYPSWYSNASGNRNNAYIFQTPAK